jgi:hypothetical protein
MQATETGIPPIREGSSTMGTKKILNVTSAPGRHWVGDGFPVHGMFGYSGAGRGRAQPVPDAGLRRPLRVPAHHANDAASASTRTVGSRP